MSADLSPGPAVDCESCGTLSPMKRDQALREACPDCGEFAEAVTIVACSDDNPAGCDSFDHHFGHGVCMVEGVR